MGALSLPLMAGVSLVTADNWIIAHFASGIGGAVSLMSYAKQFFTAPMAMLAQAAGAASMPFFASLWTQDRRYEFATGVADSVSRVASLGLLAASAMVALGGPAIDLVFTGGRFSSAIPTSARLYFAIFSVSLFLWSAQAIYARAFYAAGNTFAPMVAGTIVTLVSLPIYATLFHWHGAMGLAAGLRRRHRDADPHHCRAAAQAAHGFAGWPGLPEMGRCLAAALAAGTATWLVVRGVGALLVHAHAAHGAHASRWADLAMAIAGTAVWLPLIKIVLEKTGSALPRVIVQRLGLRRAQA